MNTSRKNEDPKNNSVRGSETNGLTITNVCVDSLDSKEEAAIWAKQELDGYSFQGQKFKIYFAEELNYASQNRRPSLLAVPKLEKQFLISPPASPPAGWQPSQEGVPVVSQELIDSLERLTARGRTHVLYDDNNSHPSITLMDCSGDGENNASANIEATNISDCRTKRPDFKS
eukprot:Nk52_evm64s1020 gene=Nk52_evmTU64s1020